MVAIEPRTFVDTDILIDIARKDPHALDFWRRTEVRSTMTSSVISVFEFVFRSNRPPNPEQSGRVIRAKAAGGRSEATLEFFS